MINNSAYLHIRYIKKVKNGHEILKSTVQNNYKLTKQKTSQRISRVPKFYLNSTGRNGYILTNS